jgi:hypothetical protein
MTTTVMLIATLLYSIIGLTAAEYAPSCTCSPQSLTLRINLSGTCPANITNVDGNNQFCFVSQIGSDSGSSGFDELGNSDADESELLPPTDPVPVSINSISYYELSESMEVINQETITLQDNNTAEVFTFTSISTNIIDPNKSISEQLQFVVSSAMLIIEGTNAAGKLLKNKVSWKYDLHQCDMIPMAIGNTLGWLDLIDLGGPRPEICPAVDVVDLTATTTASATIFSNATINGTSYTPTMSPVNTTYSSSEVIHSKEPTKLPTLAPMYPTYYPTYHPTYYPTYSPTAETAGLTTDDSEGKPPSLTGYSSGWDADGWTPPETNLIDGGTQTSIGTTTTLATEVSTSTNGTESSDSAAATAEGINTTTFATVTTSIAEETTINSTVSTAAVSTTTLATRPPKTTTTSVATRPPKPTTTTAAATRPPKTTTSSSIAATRPHKPTTTTTAAEATRPPKATTTTTQATRPPKTTTTTATKTTTTTYATRPPKTTGTTATATTTATISPKQDAEQVLSQNINYLGIENGGRKTTCSVIWLTSLVVLVMGTVLLME